METEQKRRLERDIELEEADDYLLDLRSKTFPTFLAIINLPYSMDIYFS